MLREGWQPPQVNLNVVSNYGGLGDQIARIPVYKWIHDTQTYVSLKIYVQDYFIDLARYLLPESDRLVYKRISDLKGEKPQPYLDFSPERTPGSLGMHLTQVAFLALTDRLAPATRDMSYPQAPRVPVLSSLPKNMIVFTVAFTAPAREWPAHEINTLAKKVREAGLTPVLLGSTEPQQAGDGVIQGAMDDDLDRSLFLDLTNKTTLIEALGIMQRGKVVVGLDNGLLHLAHCTGTPTVVGFTNVEAKHRLPIRLQGTTKIVEAKVPCYGCQSRGVYINMNYKYCIFDDYSCCLTMRSARFVQALKELGVFE